MKDIKESIGKVYKAITSLAMQGYDIIAVREIDGINKPTIVVQFNSRCKHTQESGRAVCYVYGNNQNVAYRRWQMNVNDCRVIWECLS